MNSGQLADYTPVYDLVVEYPFLARDNRGTKFYLDACHRLTDYYGCSIRLLICLIVFFKIFVLIQCFEHIDEYI